MAFEDSVRTYRGISCTPELSDTAVWLPAGIGGKSHNWYRAQTIEKPIPPLHGLDSMFNNRTILSMLDRQCPHMLHIKEGSPAERLYGDMMQLLQTAEGCERCQMPSFVVAVQRKATLRLAATSTEYPGYPGPGAAPT